MNGFLCNEKASKKRRTIPLLRGGAQASAYAGVCKIHSNNSSKIDNPDKISFLKVFIKRHVKKRHTPAKTKANTPPLKRGELIKSQFRKLSHGLLKTN